MLGVISELFTCSNIDSIKNTEATSAKSHETKHEENVRSEIITSSTKSWVDEGQSFMQSFTMEERKLKACVCYDFSLCHYSITQYA